jgi:hypothetical protein
MENNIVCIEILQNSVLSYHGNVTSLSPEIKKKKRTCLDWNTSVFQPSVFRRDILQAIYPGSNKQACFNLENVKPPIYCSTHKKDNMVNVKDQQCNEVGCSKRPCYGLIKATHCVTHKTVDMIDVKTKRCEYEGCNTIPTFGITKPTHCATHKSSYMKNNKAKQCLHNGCDKQPSFGLENG